ncbi:hypothetical protein [Tropicimonas sp. IMCC34043]|uniref:hypothetical protein n=1 Tax=Tropicimonas sp. IMCC34043 TaxID=2248760 RepID=UPI000E264F28|nr:hypothetical protein [Tropicimonas sp. IMCC34043]
MARGAAWQKILHVWTVARYDAAIGAQNHSHLKYLLPRVAVDRFVAAAGQPDTKAIKSGLAPNHASRPFLFGSENPLSGKKTL